MQIRGSCHCKNIGFVLTWEPDPIAIAARACSCSFCTRHGGVWTSNPSGALDVAIADPALASRYSFGTRTAEFHICSRCGVVPLVTSQIDSRTYAVNVNAFEGIDASLVQRSSIDHGDEAVEARLARRKRNWIATVRGVPHAAM